MSARPVSDAALVRRVRWRLLAWSGGSTLAVLVLLGSLIYVAVANSLSSAAVDQLRDRARMLEPRVELLTAAPPGIPPGPAFNTIVAADPGQAGVSLVGGSAAGTTSAACSTPSSPTNQASRRHARPASRSSWRTSTARPSGSCRGS